MNYQERKQWLERYRVCIDRIEELREIQRAARSNAEKVTPGSGGDIQQSGNQIIALFDGRLDTAAAVLVAEEVKPLMEAENQEIILDCTKLEYISSSGLRIFLSIRKEAAAHGSKVIVRNINDDIRQVFMMTGFISLFEIQ